MVDASKACEEARQFLAKSQSTDRAARSIAIVDGMKRLLVAGDDSEETIRGFYLRTVQAEPYERPTGKSRMAAARTMLIVRDLLNGTQPRRRYTFGCAARRSKAYAGAIESYERWMAEAGMSEKTISSRVQRANVLFEFLENLDVRSLGDLDADLLAAFV